MCDNCSDMESVEMESASNEGNPKSTTRRRALQSLGAVGSMAVGFTTVGTSTSRTPDQMKSRGSYDDGGSTQSIDVDIVDMSSDSWDEGLEVLNGMYEGYSILYENLGSVFTGFRVRLFDIDHVYEGDNDFDPLWDALVDNGFDEWKHYHVLYDGSLPPNKVGSSHRTWTGDNTLWDDDWPRGISGLSLDNTSAVTADAYTRGLHQSMHNYIDEEIAKGFADSSNGYDAIHQLGDSTTDQRTVMADIYPHQVSNGDCGDTNCTLGTCAPNPGNLQFSNCTIAAVYDSIGKNT